MATMLGINRAQVGEGRAGGRMWGETALSASAPGDLLLSTPQGSPAHWGAEVERRGSGQRGSDSAVWDTSVPGRAKCVPSIKIGLRPEEKYPWKRQFPLKPEALRQRTSVQGALCGCRGKAGAIRSVEAA